MTVGVIVGEGVAVGTLPPGLIAGAVDSGDPLDSTCRVSSAPCCGSSRDGVGELVTIDRSRGVGVGVGEACTEVGETCTGGVTTDAGATTESGTFEVTSGVENTFCLSSPEPQAARTRSAISTNASCVARRICRRFTAGFVSCQGEWRPEDSTRLALTTCLSVYVRVTGL